MIWQNIVSLEHREMSKSGTELLFLTNHLAKASDEMESQSCQCSTNGALVQGSKLSNCRPV